MMILKVEDLLASYGRVQVLKDLNLEIGNGEIVCIVGANGAGKSTLLKVISGIVPAAQGKISFEGRDITNKKPEQLVRIGLSHVPEGRQIFGTLTVRQNLLLGAYAHRINKEEMEKRYQFVFNLFPILQKRLLQKAGTMSGGEQQMLAIGRGLMSQPKLLLLDEPSLGLAPLIVQDIFSIIKDLRAGGLPILLVEQNVAVALEIADRAYIMETGKIVSQGSAKTLLENDEVRKRYLGL
jgi:branched-chain amino acid transport system ATP-binding protein